MVRLLLICLPASTPSNGFQFLNGTIITYRCKQPVCASHVSIPQWYDYYDTRTVASDVNRKFQFLNGTIITHYNMQLKQEDLVSIPQWYDYYVWRHQI